VGRPVFGLVGALAAIPRRIAARDAGRHGSILHRGTTRRTTHAVFGRRLLDRLDDAAIAARAEAERAAGRTLLSENGFLRRIGALGAGPGGDLARAALLQQSQLAPETFDLLALFDAFEHDAEPYALRDVILARKYAGLIAGGADWGAIVRSIHRSGPAVSLTAKSLKVGAARAIYAESGDALAELDGQLLLGLPAAEDDAEDLFAAAEAAEAAGAAAAAARLYARCLALDPTDAVAAFNRGNCLRASGQRDEAEREMLRAVRQDPTLVEAWFNLADLLAERGRHDAARRHLARAIEEDPDYANAAFNLAALAFDAGDHATAARCWRRYVELDPGSAWARKAERGLRYLATAGRTG
jgi:tetratricopeptide (TPR) repeat protein